MAQTLTIIFWAITYILIIVAGFKSTKIRKVSMPYVAGVMNFAWEICASIVTNGFWGNIVGVALDVFIVYFGFRYAKGLKQRITYALSIVISTVVMYYIALLPNGLLFSVFLIDLIMAVWYLIVFKRLSPTYMTSIAVARLLGDVFAAFACASQAWYVPVMGILVFICNLLYLCLCLESKSREHKKLRKR